MDEAATRRFSFWALVAFLGCVLIAGASFLPWIAPGAKHRSNLGVGDGDLRSLEDAARKQGKDAEEMLALLKKLRGGGAATGRELVSLFGWSLAHAKTRETLEPREERVFVAAYWSLALLPWVAGALGLLLLLDRLRRMRSWSIAAMFVLGIVLGGLAGLMWLGASVQAREHTAETAIHLGLGLEAIAVGGLACFLGAVFGVGAKTWWRGWGLGLLLSAALVGGIVFYVRG